MSEHTQSTLTPNGDDYAFTWIKDLYAKGFAAGVQEATSQQDKDAFIAGQIHAYDMIMATFSNDYRNQDIQMVLQIIAKLKKETENQIPKEMDIQ